MKIFVCFTKNNLSIIRKKKKGKKKINETTKKDTAHKTGTKGSTVLSRSDGNTDFVHPISIQKFTYGEGRGQHPTQKPVTLFEYLLKTYSNENMIIFDPCMGSGTTGVACKNLNRNFIGIEKDEAYFKIAEQRINARTLFS